MMDGFQGKSCFLLANTSLPANRRRSTAFLDIVQGGTNCWMTTPKDWICIRHWVKYSGFIFQEKDGKGRQQLIIIDSKNESKRGNLDVTNDTKTTLIWFLEASQRRVCLPVKIYTVSWQVSLQTILWLQNMQVNNTVYVADKPTTTQTQIHQSDARSFKWRTTGKLVLTFDKTWWKWNKVAIIC